jgi:hypothetical protein
MDITPETNFLWSIRGQRINYGLLIGEAIDNSLDAAANNITISILQDKIEVADDGSGIARSRISSLFKLGGHGGMQTTMLGRYGVGLKEQAVNAGDVLSISSTSSDGKFEVGVNWNHVFKSGIWNIPDPQWIPVSVGTDTGTIINISKLRKPPSINLDKIKQEIAERFHPALVVGKSIAVNGHKVMAVQDPTMRDIVERTFNFSNGRCAQLRGGILLDRSEINSVHVSFGHRVIMPKSAFGCSGYSGLSKLFARLALTGPWRLAKFKDDLTDEKEREELEDCVTEALLPILEECNSASMEAHIDALSDAVNSLIPEYMRAARPLKTKVDPPTSSDKKKPQNRPVNQDSASIGDGPARVKSKRNAGLMICFDRIGSERIGDFSDTRPKRVTLSLDNEFVANLSASRDQKMAAQSIFMAAMSIYIAEAKDPELPFDEFGVRLATLLALQAAA